MYEEICKKLQDLSNSSKTLCDELKAKDKEPELTDEEKKKEKKKWSRASKWILGISIALGILISFIVPNMYGKVFSNGQKTIEIKEDYYSAIQGNLPPSILITEKAISTRKSISYEEQVILSSLVDKDDSLYANYQKVVNQLAYESNNMTIPEMGLLFLLTLCFVYLGCLARTLFDYIGWTCYKDGQDMKKWWPWYVFRPAIGVPIAAFIIVASRCAMFSTLFTSRDLNTYLVISFLAGFAMMEFLSLLRSVSKGLFDKF